MHLNQPFELFFRGTLAQFRALFGHTCPPPPRQLKAAIIWGDVRSQSSPLPLTLHTKDCHMSNEQTIQSNQEADCILDVALNGVPIPGENYGPEGITWMSADASIATANPDPTNGLKCTYRAQAVGRTDVSAAGTVLIEGVSTPFLASGNLTVTQTGGGLVAALNWTDVRMQTR